MKQYWRIELVVEETGETLGKPVYAWADSLEEAREWVKAWAQKRAESQR